MGRQSFFVGGSYLGSRTIETNRVVPGLEVRPHYSYALFCMQCGEIWGRLHHDKARLTQVVTRPCLEHGCGRLSNNHKYAGEPTYYESDWPAAATRHEFQAILKEGERLCTASSPLAVW